MVPSILRDQIHEFRRSRMRLKELAKSRRHRALRKPSSNRAYLNGRATEHEGRKWCFGQTTLNCWHMIIYCCFAIISRFYPTIQREARKGRGPKGSSSSCLKNISPHTSIVLQRTSKSILICRSELPIEDEPYPIRYRFEDEDEPAPNAKTYRLRLQGTGALRVSELMDYLTSTNASSLFGSKDEIIQALNIVIGQHPKAASNIFSIGANKHFELDPARSETMSLGAGLQAIRGFFISVRGATARMLVNVHVKHAACYDQGPLSQLMFAYLRENGPNMVKLRNFLKSVRVQVSHIVRKNKSGQEIPRIKTIAGLATSDDGHGLPHPPIVPKFAAGAKEVKFFVGSPGEEAGGKEAGSGGKSRKKGKMPAKTGPQPPQEDYISVYDFFQRSKCLYSRELGTSLG